MELQHFSHKHPLVCIEKQNHESEKAYCSGCGELVSGSSFNCGAKCFACWQRLLDFAYLDLDHGIFLHKKCVDLPTEINHFLHSPDSLILQFNSKPLPCQMCKKTQVKGFVYRCSPCEVALHITCAELPTKIKHLCHRNHPLFLKFDPESLPCQICQKTQDQGLVYCCSICKFKLHIDCASPPPIIKGEIHEHPFTLFWKQVPFICDACGTTGNCASYTCYKCSLTIHEKCISLPPIIKFPRHRHRLSHTFILGQYEMKTWICEACPEEVNAQHGVYCCSDCNYIVHADCVQEYSWFSFDDLEYMDEDLNEKSAFAVIRVTKLGEDIVIASEIKHLNHQHNLVLSNDSKGHKVCDGWHKHRLYRYDKYEGQCNGCGDQLHGAYVCKDSNFTVHNRCLRLPNKIQHEYDEHPLILTYHEDNLYSEYTYCDICEETRNPNH
ncbi:hypothetical protein PVK06_021434 [Gossypium arboreum]|uniref:Phorbol-ester/DAG-type domain-containing protein n=1 Tax=Gossypium arboreum TaxID=29729 RepID=A0ABR0PPZ3_GOSAR|nr:hypothetical protein PVK06_021434 [Gossypium arboreum]